MKRISTIILVVICLVGCNDFVDIGTPRTQIVKESVFSNDAGARAAMAGIYSKLMSNNTFAGGGNSGITEVAGLSADELDNYSSIPAQVAVYNNSLTPLNTVQTMWDDAYSCIYNANSVLEGLGESTGVSEKVRSQVRGEALFIRAFSYFYLVNFYGDTPLLKTTDYRINNVASRTPALEVYAQIETDLLDAKELLVEDYSFSGGEKVNPNKWVATALLARVYLYQKKWNDAEVQANAIIESHQFSLVADLNSVFLANSDEAIWQLMPSLPGYNTNDGPNFIIAGTPSNVGISSSALNVFEPDDSRALSWIGSYTGDDNNTYYYVYKYKVHDYGMPLTEYNMVLRLAEQYLIRAEARAMQNDLTGAMDDVNIIRARAGLSSIDGTGFAQQDVLDAIDQERRAELFVEWGHRWFDLKRAGKIDAVLGAVKPDWQSNDALFPIAQAEIVTNPNLVQNPK